MKKLAFIAIACVAFAPSAFAYGSGISVRLSNSSFVVQGGRNGSADVALVAQGAYAVVQSPTSSPNIVINTGFAGAPIGSSFSWTVTPDP
jgi:hypothetical protein